MALKLENTTSIQSVWAQRCADDLAANRKEQSEVTDQIARLQERLNQLRGDEEWLIRAQGALPLPPVDGEDSTDGAAGEPESAGDDQPLAGGSEGEPTVPAETADTAAATSPVPQPRQEAQAKASPPGPTSGKTAASKAKAAATKTQAGKKSATKRTTAAKKSTPRKAADATAQPPLHTLALHILQGAPGQPRLAREVHDELLKQHPDRAGVSVQSVRNTLDTLFRRKIIDKTNQQGSAMYTAPAANTTTDTKAEQRAEAPSHA
ncbi:hypothetical protein AB0N17_45665 [Streptomyces sp. NPDC051133]|uniref:hypothetical protein n=1 Tax=Streptomyces sp. NPDC051133 TaxID=3155521 RepID=UPI003444F4DF